MNRFFIATLLLATLAMAGCAADASTKTSDSSAASTEEPVTGSRLPPPKSRLPEK